MLGKFSNWIKRNEITEETAETILPEKIPNHVAIIMDGNGRWAKKRGLPRIAGHREGVKVVKKIVRKANGLGIKTLTLYAFSTENWKRPKDEVDFLMKLPEQFLINYLPELVEQNVQVQIMGEKDQLPGHTLKAVSEAVEQTKNNTGLILNFALNYGSRYEITHAVKQLINDVQEGKISQGDISEESIAHYFLNNNIADPDLLIRTSGEIRLSNFMLWQLAYAELWFTDVLWPDFTEDHLVQAILEYQHRGRRYGGL
ncbi:isoprenyl transferase [Pseudalkalibacillus caeni]|uniref:Isoprenyl transferase n=1 Tax=Exobacillus caeni TaxID=2574798 RepID=A0A5R9F148_9BACL|nr:isoprenyl transferase [Pseudalkalibacillus caeni]TLS37362.1 isoprenyl transferase [Pseudalkalibacillus caeni]